MQYFYSLDGTTQQGPLEAAELPRAGVGPTTMVWREGMPDWLPAGRVAELAAIVAVAPPAAEPPPTPPPGGTIQLPPQGLMNTYGPGAPRQPGTNGLGIAALVLGLFGLAGVFGQTTCCCMLPLVASILAIIFGHIARGQIRRGFGTGAAVALAGLILGYVGIGATALGIGLGTHRLHLQHTVFPIPRQIGHP